MDREPPLLEIKFWGDYACFTRPEMKVERVSYPVMTPSAARGALEAIFWKPQIAWRVNEIHVLRPIEYASILRNEINDRQSERTARRWANEGGGYDASANRAQRHTLALRCVAYVVRAQMLLQESVNDDIAKYRDQFRRRVGRGQCFSTPYLGCREFSASFGEPTRSDTPIALSEDLGPMLLDIDYAPDGSGRGVPQFFHATIEGGVMRIPDRFAEVS
ncbi:MAG: type I-C CRISPR-associated protein Cas5 [Gammaproteobacteria bacterium]|nr:type I-C CRISPR-associated protein Cas5 [Gammaproteobacteria bacterium]